MPPGAEAREWWADVEDVRERIERRRADDGASVWRARGVREVRPGPRLMLVRPSAPPSPSATRRRRPRPRAAQRLGPRPDIFAAWAVALGVVLVAVALLSAHG